MANFVTALMVGIIAFYGTNVHCNMPGPGPDPITGPVFGFPISSKSVSEGSSVDVDFGQIGGAVPPGSVYYCLIRLLNTGSATFNVDFKHSFSGNEVQFVLNAANSYLFSFQITAEQDNIVDPLEDADYHGYCYLDSQRTERVDTERCNFKVVITNSDLTDDPHFFQNVLGMDEDNKIVSENICYDLVGTAGDIYEILTDKILDVSVLCELRDDYYIGQIRIKTPLGLFIATTETVSVQGRFTRSWSDVARFERGTDPTLSVEIMKEYVIVEINGGGRRMAIRADRVMQDKRGKKYLNFYIEETASNGGIIFDKYHGGLFGVAANNKYKFLNSVQVDTKVSTVVVNGVHVNAFRQTSPVTNRGCYLMNLEDVISPHTKSYFMKSF